MRVEELTNYGKGFLDIGTDPESVKRERKTMAREFRRELGLRNMLRMGRRMIRNRITP